MTSDDLSTNSDNQNSDNEKAVAGGLCFDLVDKKVPSAVA